MSRSTGLRRRAFVRVLSGKLFLFAVSFVFFLYGCSRDQGPPPPLTLEQLPAAIEKAFAKPKPEASEPVKSLLAALNEKDYLKALSALQTVSAQPGLNKEQARVAAAGLVTINNALQEA